MAWLSGYNYRKSITLSRASGAVSNYQMKLLLGESSGATGEDVDCGGYCLSSFNDLRFTKADGTTLLDYWIESISGTTPNQLATVWIEFDSIGTGATTFYMYYGNSSASAVSNGDNTFIVFDDFERGSSGDAIGGDWTLEGSVQISTTQKYGGTRSAKLIAGATVPDARMALNAASGEYAIRVRIYKHDNAEISFCNHGNGTNRITIGLSPTEAFVYWDGSDWQSLGKSGVATSWFLAEVANIDFTAGTYDFYYNDALLCETVPMQASNLLEDVVRFRGHSTSTNDSYFDNVVVRNWRSIEPAWGSWGAMEEWAEGITTETATATDTFDGGSLSYATSESAEATATFDGDSLRDSTSESAEATDTFGNERTAYGLTTESAEATDTMGALHLVDATTESASASDSMEAEDLIRKKIKFPNLQGKHLSLKFESATDGSFAIYYLRHKMFKTRELTSDQKHPNTHGSHIGIKLSNSGSDEFILMYVSEKMQLVTT